MQLGTVEATYLSFEMHGGKLRTAEASYLSLVIDEGQLKTVEDTT